MSEVVEPVTPVVEAPAVADPAPIVADSATPIPAPAPVPGAPSEPAEPTGGEWPADWRQKYSADPAVQKRLERYGSPKAALDAMFAAQNRIAKGDLLPTLKDNATPEDISEYRTAHGIPETPEWYDLTLANGLVVGEEDKALVNEFLTTAHGQHMHPSQVKETLSWYLGKQQEEVAAQESRDQESRISCVDELRNEFGPDYKREVKIAMDVLENAPEGIKDRFLGGRLADGIRIGNDPAVIRWLNTISRELNPVATVVPGSGMNAAQAIETELGALRAKMGDSKSDYWKGPTAAKQQERYRQLVGAASKGR